MARLRNAQSGSRSAGGPSDNCAVGSAGDEGVPDPDPDRTMHAGHLDVPSLPEVSEAAPEGPLAKSHRIRHPGWLDFKRVVSQWHPCEQTTGPPASQRLER